MRKEQLRHVLEFELIHIVVMFVLALIVTGHIGQASLLAVLEPLIMASIHYVLEVRKEKSTKVLHKRI
mgnify:CR=1 FL=1